MCPGPDCLRRGVPLCSQGCYFDSHFASYSTKGGIAMEMQDIGINLSSDVVKALTSYGERCGWSLEETIRFIIGSTSGHARTTF